MSKSKLAQIELPPITTGLSIIIVSYKRLDCLRKCVRSIIDTVKQTRYEIIIVDNQSADGTPEGIRREFPSLRMIENTKNLGFAKENLGFAKKNLGFAKENLGFAKGNLGFAKEILDFAKEDIGFGKENIGFAKEILSSC